MNHSEVNAERLAEAIPANPSADPIPVMNRVLPSTLPLVGLRSGLALVRLHRMQHDLVRVLLRVATVPFAPVVTHRVCENVAIPGEVGRADRAAHLGVALQPVLRVLVPEVKCSVGASCREGAVLRMEADGVDGEDVAGIAVRGVWLAVALEAEVVALVLLIDVLDGTASFNTAHCETRAVAEGAQHARLPFEGRLHGLVEGGRVLEVDHVDPSFCRADYEQLIPAHVHRVDSVLAFDGSHRCLLAEIPVFDHLVPAASDEHGRAAEHDAIDASDGLIVSGDLRGLLCARSQVQHSRGLISACAEHLLAVLEHIELVYPLKWCCAAMFHTLLQQQSSTGPSKSIIALPCVCPLPSTS